MAHFNSEGLVTRLEADTTAATPLLVKAERAKSLSAMLLGAQQNEPEPSKSESSAVLELVHVAPEPTDSVVPDPLIQGLMDRLPKPDSVWSLDDRGKWLRAAAVIFSLIYKLDEGDRDRRSSEPKALP
jgi:hypothetical protein